MFRGINVLKNIISQGLDNLESCLCICLLSCLIFLSFKNDPLLIRIPKNCGYPVESYGPTVKISPRAYIFQGPFLRGLFLKGIIFGGAHRQWIICLTKSIGLALKKCYCNVLTLFYLSVFKGNFDVEALVGLYSNGGAT